MFADNMDTLIPNPKTGPERGQNLRALLTRGKISTAEFAKWCGIGPQTVHIWVNGGKTDFGRDLLLEARPATREKLLRGLRRLQPQWKDADLWSAFGVAEDQRAAWRLEPTDEQIEVELIQHTFSSLGGVISSEVPIRLDIAPGAQGFMVWALPPNRTVGMVLPYGEVLPRGELLGALAGLHPL